MSVLDHFSSKAAPRERGAFDSGLKAIPLVRIGLFTLAGAIGTALAIALDPVLNLFSGG